MAGEPSARIAGPVQGWILVTSGWLSVMANQVLAPMLPTMTAIFRSQPHVQLLISLTATGPALFVALLALPFGFLADGWGRKRLLVSANLVYGLAGIAPFWLSNLGEIVITRFAVGIAEAAVMTCGAALIGDFFSGRSRERYFALLTGTAPIVSSVVTLLGGSLGRASWHAPFLIYGFPFVLIPLIGLFLWEPRQAADCAKTPSVSQKGQLIPWGVVFWRCCVTIFGMSAFLVTAIQGSFLLDERGVTSPAMIGLLMGAVMLSNPVGALMFSVLKLESNARLAVSFGLLAFGHCIMALSTTWPGVIAGATVANLGAGFILPTLLTWTLAGLGSRQRTITTGAWMSACFLGQFLSPLSIMGLQSVAKSLSMSILVYAAASGIAAACAVFSVNRARRA